MATATHTLLVALLVLSASVWTGGIVTIVVVARSARLSLEPAARVALFRHLGRAYLGVGATALVVALASGATLVTRRGWDGPAVASGVVAALIVAVLVVAVGQARRMTVLRQSAAEDGADTGLAKRIAAGGRAAGALRGLLGVLTLVLVVLGCALAV